MTTTRLMARGMALILTLALTPSVAAAQSDDGWPTVESFADGFEVIDGYFPMYWDDEKGALWLEVSRLGGDSEVLYINSLATGVGSNDIGLDRGQIGGARIARFERVGPKILMVQPNYGYRAETTNPDERRAVVEAFAQSVLWGFTVSARTDDRFLVDATEFLLRDAHGVADNLPGTYRLEHSRSAVYLPRTKGFPQNTELEATLTFVRERTGEGRGTGRGSIQAVTPSAEAVTVRQHHSLVELPDDAPIPPIDQRTFRGGSAPRRELLSCGTDGDIPGTDFLFRRGPSHAIRGRLRQRGAPQEHQEQQKREDSKHSHCVRSHRSPPSTAEWNCPGLAH